MRYYLGTFLLFLSACFCHGQELSRQDSLKLRDILDGRDVINSNAMKEIKNLFEPELMMHSNKDLLFDFSLPKTDFKKEYPLIYPKFNLRNSLPDITNRNFSGTFLFEKNTENFSFSESYRRQMNFSLFTIHSEFSYKLDKRWSLDFSRTHNSNNYNNALMPNSLFRDEFGGGVSYKISLKLKFTTGFRYVYNVATKRWEWVLSSAVNYDF